MDLLSSTNICRCCLIKEENVLFDLNEIYEENTLLIECFKILTGISLKNHTSQHTKVCYTCQTELIVAYKFRQKAITSHEKLEQLIKIECDGVTEDSVLEVKYEPECEIIYETESSNVSKPLKYKERRKKSKKFEVSIKKDISDEEIFSHQSHFSSPDFESQRKQKNRPKQPKKNQKPDKRFECHHCGHVSDKKVSLKVHLQRMHFNHLKKHLCDNCGQKFVTGAELNVHVRTIHKNEKLYQCNQCPRTYLYLQSLKVHLTSHSDVRQFVCELCSASYKTRAALFNHKKQHLFPNKEYICKECGNIYNTKIDYEKHINEMHSSDKKFCCMDCGKRLKSKRSYEEHRRYHTGELVKCPQCPKQYPTENRLSKHILYVHSGQEKQYKCHLCSAAFHLMSNWRRHLRSVHK